MIGIFKQPRLVISDTDTLTTLPQREILNGLGEIAKYWICWGEPDMTKYANINLPWDRLILLCQRIKLNIIKKDPFDENGEREKLNLGHTIGHAFEAVSEEKLSHGQAVVLGLVSAAKISVLKGILAPIKYQKIIKTISNLHIQTVFSAKVTPWSRCNLVRRVKSALSYDKKGGTFVLIRDIGVLETGIRVEEKLINKVLMEIII